MNDGTGERPGAPARGFLERMLERIATDRPPAVQPRPALPFELFTAEPSTFEDGPTPREPMPRAAASSPGRPRVAVRRDGDVAAAPSGEAAQPEGPVVVNAADTVRSDDAIVRNAIDVAAAPVAASPDTKFRSPLPRLDPSIDTPEPVTSSAPAAPAADAALLAAAIGAVAEPARPAASRATAPASPIRAHPGRVPHARNSAAVRPRPDRPSAPVSPAVPDAAGSPPVPDDATAPGEKVVRISIGRIEVRAVVEAPKPPAAPRPRATPRLELDEYLRQRTRGER